MLVKAAQSKKKIPVLAILEAENLEKLNLGLYSFPAPRGESRGRPEPRAAGAGPRGKVGGAPAEAEAGARKRCYLVLRLICHGQECGLATHPPTTRPGHFFGSTLGFPQSNEEDTAAQERVA